MTDRYEEIRKALEGLRERCAQEHQGEYRREDDPNFNEASTGDLLAQAEYWDAVARVKEVRNA